MRHAHARHMLALLAAGVSLGGVCGRAEAQVTPPSWWLAQAACIRSHEGWWTANTGNSYYGAYQFLLSTWRSAGGRGYPHQATPAEQTYRAWVVWKRDGGSWREWGTARACGLR